MRFDKYLAENRVCYVCKYQRPGYGIFGDKCTVKAKEFIDPVNGDIIIKPVIPCRIARLLPICKFDSGIELIDSRYLL